ncbi:protein PTHB1 isoform X2 [Galleria mellonella]|uniref:Protein PTHB1 isoform X2 n=1 Tax=Galleria mellonella TaxID=7137 RepID=A0A6J1WYW3_GALME|nr:protein PTHB1 isoform X2 [Galleria mellonella]
MSIFKVKQWWTNDKLQLDETISGVQNATCLKVEKFNSHSDSDCIVISEEYLLKIYKPYPNQETSNVVLETHLGDVALQIETGKFLTGSVDRQILVLHPQSYAIYQLERKEGHTDAGEQNVLKLMIKHSFTRRADSLVHGSFGNVKSRDFICIQGIDGSLSFFDQDTFLFMCILNDVIIPGPVCYIASCDSFVICKSTWILEIYSYQQLREFSELNVRQNKKNIPQWIYNAGEEVTSVQVIQTSNNFSSIIALGERHLYCFQDNGLMKFMIKFDYMPTCFHAYLIGWYYEPGARLLVMLASDDAKLYVYENTSLLWSCDLFNTAISISRCFLKSLPGGIVTLSNTGVVTVCYLGTEPDLNSNAAPMINEEVDPEQIQAELEKVEQALQAITENKEQEITNEATIDEIIKIKADVGKPVQNLTHDFTNDSSEGLHLLMCPIIIILTCKDPKLIQNVQITYACCPPFAFSESTICLDNINGTEIIETQVFIESKGDVSETAVDILFTITDSVGKIIVLSRKITLPITLYCLPVDVVLENEIKLFINSNQSCVDFSEIFADFSEQELLQYGGSPEIVTFSYRANKKTVTLKSSGEQYSIEADDFPEIASILDYFIFKLMDHFARMGISDFRFYIKCDKEFIKQITHKFLKSIEAHAKERIKLKTFEDDLNVLQKQFTLIQKRLLVQYGSLPPGDCDQLEFLMKDTHKRLVDSVHEIIICRENVCRSSTTLMAIGHLIIHILKQTTPDDFKLKLIEEMLSLNTIYELYQEWEEAVTQALSYIVNNVLQKSEKDKEKLAPVTEQGILSHINLKRFLKQIRMVLDKMFSDAWTDDTEATTHKPKEKITRIEEFVEVI